MKYTVRVKQVYFTDVQVEAESELEALTCPEIYDAELEPYGDADYEVVEHA